MMNNDRFDLLPANPMDSRKSMKPHAEKLLQTTKSFLRETNMVWKMLVHKAYWLPHHYPFLEISVEEGIADVNFSKLQ